MGENRQVRRRISVRSAQCDQLTQSEREKRWTSKAREQLEGGKHERTNTSERLRFYLTGHTILKISIFEYWIQLETTTFFFLALHIDLELGFAPRYPIAFDGVRLLGVPTATTGLLTDRRGKSKGISCQLAEVAVGSGAISGWRRGDLREVG